MFRSSDHKIHAGLCLMIKDLISYEPFCENLLTEDSLGHIIGNKLLLIAFQGNNGRFQLCYRKKTLSQRLLSLFTAF